MNEWPWLPTVSMTDEGAKDLADALRTFAEVLERVCVDESPRILKGLKEISFDLWQASDNFSD